MYGERNLSLLLDLYELTMSGGFVNNAAERAAFDVYFRRVPDGGGYAVFAGLRQIAEYLTNLRFGAEDVEYLRGTEMFGEEFLRYLENFSFGGDVYAFPEGAIIYPGEPVLTVIAPVCEAQIAETFILMQINHQSLIATKASRIVRAARGAAVYDFGARRAHNADAAVYGARAAYIGGADGTSNVLAAKLFSIPVSGTMAHSWVMFYGDEYEAFAKFLRAYPDSAVLLADTYDTLKSGVPNAIRAARNILLPQGKRLKGIRIDSGNLAYLSKKARKMLDDAGFGDCKIYASNSLDEFTVNSLTEKGAAIDGFGVGERLITAKSEPVFGAVYKLAAVEKNGEFEPRIKISESAKKITLPGLKTTYRIYDERGEAVADLIANRGETVDLSKPYLCVDPSSPTRMKRFSDCTAREMQIPVIRNGRLARKFPSLKDVRGFVKSQLDGEIPQNERRFENPAAHPIVMTPEYYRMKSSLMRSIKQ